MSYNGLRLEGSGYGRQYWTIGDMWRATKDSNYRTSFFLPENAGRVGYSSAYLKFLRQAILLRDCKRAGKKDDASIVVPFKR